MSLEMGTEYVLNWAINETDTLAGTSAELVAPVSGYIDDLQVTVQKAVGTGGTVKAAIGTTDVVGASVTVEDAATKGTRYSATATKPSTTRAVSKGDRIQIIPAADFATSGAVSGNLIINTAH